MNKFFKLYAGIITTSGFSGATFETIKQIKNMKNEINDESIITEKNIYERSLVHSGKLINSTFNGGIKGLSNGIVFPYSFPLMMYMYKKNKTDNK